MSPYTITFNPRWYVDVEYDSYYNCEANGCDSICRCGRLSNLRVEKVNLSPSMVTIIYPHQMKRGVKQKTYKPSVIDQYCIDRLLRIHKVYDTSAYEVGVERGYYGEEVGDVSFNRSCELISDVTKLMECKTDAQKVKFVLEREYAYVLDLIKDTTEVAVVSKKPATLITNVDYLARIKREPYDIGEFLPVGVIYRDRLLDGYHRFSTLDPKKQYPFIVLS